MSPRRLPAALLAAALAASPAVARTDRPLPWQALITQPDRLRLRLWRDTMQTALDQARRGGAGARVDALGPLLQPDAALETPMPPDGDYACRVVKLGTLAAGNPSFSEQPGFHCRIAGGRFAKLDGLQRPAGRLWTFDGAHALLLGALALGDETRVLAYGRDRDRDLIGLVERIGDRRWRILLPRPRWESLFNVIELVPAA